MNTEGADSIPSTYRSVDWTTWLVWIAVCALEPLLWAVWNAAWNKTVLRADPNAGLIGGGIGATIVPTPLALPILEWLALRRIAPRLNIAVWYGTSQAARLLWVLLLFAAAAVGVRGGDVTTNYGASFLLAYHRLRGAPLSLIQMLTLPWSPLLLSTAATTGLTCLLPAWVLGHVSKQRWFVFLIAAISGACAAAVMDQLYNIYGWYRPIGSYELLNGHGWVERSSELLLRAGVGATWGAMSGFVLVISWRFLAAGPHANSPPHMIGRPSGLAAMGLVFAAIAISPPFVSYLMGPLGIRGGLPALHRLFALAPAQDVSEGDSILTHSHDASIVIPRFPTVSFAPDGASFVTLNADREFVLINTATGQSLGVPNAGPPSPEHYSQVWSPNGHFFLLRSTGPAVAIPSTHQTIQRSRVRAYEMPDFRPVGEFVGPDNECFDREPIVFDPDGESVWLACGQFPPPKPDDLLAIRLAVPSMTMMEQRHYGESASAGEISVLQVVGRDVWAWQYGYRPNARFRIRDLTSDRDMVVLGDLKVPDLAGNLTFQPQWTELDAKHLTLVFCGDPANLSAAGHPKNPLALWICRTLRFEIPTGALIETIDGADRTIRPARLSNFGGLQIETVERQDSKTGQTIVREIKTGRVRQQIASVNQHLLGGSPDRRRLVMLATEQGKLRIYRVTP